MAAQRMELLASAAQTGSGVGDKRKVSTLTMAQVTVDVTAGSGTISDFTFWLEGSDDGGTTWYELVADQVLKSSAVAASNAATANVRDIIDGKATTTAERFVAVFKHLCADYVRPRWTLAGTTPSLTFSSKLVGK